MKKLFSVLVFLLLVLGVVPSFSVVSPTDISSSILPSTKQSAPISINGNTDFTNQAKLNGWRGNGSGSNPFIIENLLINGNESLFGVIIQNTNLSFVLANITVINCEYGIYLWKSKNFLLSSNSVSYTRIGVYLWKSNDGTLKNNTVTGSNIAGVLIELSYGITLSNNSIIDASNVGFYVMNSGDLQISGNKIYGYPGVGILINSGPNTMLLNNTVSGSRNGIQMGGSPNSVIKRNTLFNNGNSLSLSSSSNSTLQDNVIYSNTVGIVVSDSNNNKIVNNTAFSNIRGGIALIRSINSTFAGNKVSLNSDGISITDSSEILLVNNTATNNSKTGISVISSTSSTFINNTATNNSKTGISVISSTSSTFINNTAFDNSQQYYLSGSTFVKLRKNVAQSTKVKQFTMKEKTFGNTLNWTIYDDRPRSYFVYNNSNLYLSGTWVSGLNSVNLDNFTKGTYNLTVVFKNGYGDVIKYMTWLNVLFNPHPENRTTTASKSTSIPTIFPTSSVTTPGFLGVFALTFLIILVVFRRRIKRQ